MAESARWCSYNDYQIVIAEFLIGADPDGELPKDHNHNNQLNVTARPDGTYTINGRLDPLTGQAIKTAVDHRTQQLRQQHTNDNIESTVGQRRAAALVELVTTGFTRPDGTTPVPLIEIVMSQNIAEATLHALADDTVDYPAVDNNDLDCRCSFIDGTPLHPAHAGAALLVAQLRRHVFDIESRPIDVSYKSRSFPQWIRTVCGIVNRGRCDHDGCDAPWHWIQTDHTHPHTLNGQTHHHNSTPACGADNGWKADNPHRTGKHHRRRRNRGRKPSLDYIGDTPTDHYIRQRLHRSLTPHPPPEAPDDPPRKQAA